MRIVSDLHIHSKYSRACSPDLTPANIDKWARIKGINLVGTGDFTHPKWLAEMKGSLEPAEEGFYKLKGSDSATRFVLSSEIACIYSQAGPSRLGSRSEAGKLRRMHLVVLLPSITAVEKFNKTLESRGGKLGSDGRPILGMNSQEVLKYALDADPQALMIPAHAWTPYFGIFGSKSGFDSVEECFGEMTSHVFALETGLSSDPAMNWRVSDTDKFALVSNSDAHSLQRIGREANVMDIPPEEFNYREFYRILKEKDQKKFTFTIEYFPEEGKYHLDGHGPCKFSCMPDETAKHGGRCPVCGKKITVGVVSRVEDLADRAVGFEPPGRIPQKHLVPLEEVLADCLAVGAKSKSVQDVYWKLIENAGSELSVLLDLPIDELKITAGSVIAEAVRRVRQEEVHKIPGYDGVYGQILVYTPDERQMLAEKEHGRQDSLFSY